VLSNHGEKNCELGVLVLVKKSSECTPLTKGNTCFIQNVSTFAGSFVQLISLRKPSQTHLTHSKVHNCANGLGKLRELDTVGILLMSVGVPSWLKVFHPANVQNGCKDNSITKCIGMKQFQPVYILHPHIGWYLCLGNTLFIYWEGRCTYFWLFPPKKVKIPESFKTSR